MVVEKQDHKVHRMQRPDTADRSQTVPDVGRHGKAHPCDMARHREAPSHLAINERYPLR